MNLYKKHLWWNIILKASIDKIVMVKIKNNKKIGSHETCDSIFFCLQLIPVPILHGFYSRILPQLKSK